MKERISLTPAILVSVLAIVFAGALLVTQTQIARADSESVTFESPTYALGNINGQDGWSKTGAYDVAVASNTPVVAGFGSQVLRISNAVTSGAFGDQTFSKSLVNEAGETISTNSGMSGGIRQPHFEAQFDFASASSSQQPGLAISVSPDRGDGSRMSYLRFVDDVTGIDVFFDDVSGTSSPVSFNEVQVADNLSRTVAHTAKLSIDYIDGPSNDVVKVYIDGVLVHTGTSWENYYRYDAESASEQTPRTTDNLLFRAGGTAAPGTAGSGFFIDNVSMLSGPTSVPAGPVTVTIIKNIDGVHATTTATSSFPMSATWSSTSTGSGSGSFSLGPVGFNNPNPYEATTADMTSGASYSTFEVTSTTTGAVVGADCSTGAMYRLVGYSSGDSRGAAASSTVSTTTPSFTNITTNKYVYVWNATCVGTTTPPTATTSVKVHILKYLDGVKATAASSSSFMFPMTSTWNSSNLNSGATSSGSYVLGNNHGGAADQYGADTAAMDSPANYSTSEVTSTSTGSVLPIGAACETDKYRLLGYKTSAISFADAAVQAISSTSPNFWALNTDRYVIVLNQTCNGSTTPPPTPFACAASSTPAGYTRVDGTHGNDKITIAPNTFYVGNGGNDQVTGGDGNYIICTGPGNDHIMLGNGNARVEAGGGNNHVETGNGTHTIITGAGNDKITTGNGVDTIDAGGGNNNIASGGSNDSITTGNGNDKINGGAGTGDSCSAGGGNNNVTNCEL